MGGTGATLGPIGGAITGGGGGGGYFGGGGGASEDHASGGGGGGGSSFAHPSATGVIHTQGVRVGRGADHDRLVKPWRHQWQDQNPVRFTSFSASFRVRADDDALLAGALERAPALGWTRIQDDEASVDYVIRRDRHNEQAYAYQLECNGAAVFRTTELDLLLDAFEDHAKIQTAWRAQGMLFVHAGVIGWRGHGIVMPGRSGTGKTTLVRALIEAGAEYYSDEFALLDANGRVHPYARPLSIRNAGTRATRCPAERMGARIGTTPLAVRLIVSTEYRRGARWRPHLLSKAEAVLALMANTVAARRLPQETLPSLREAVLHARAIRSPRGGSSSVVGRLLAEI